MKLLLVYFKRCEYPLLVFRETTIFLSPAVHCYKVNATSVHTIQPDPNPGFRCLLAGTIGHTGYGLRYILVQARLSIKRLVFFKDFSFLLLELLTENELEFGTKFDRVFHSNTRLENGQRVLWADVASKHCHLRTFICLHCSVSDICKVRLPQ